MCYCLLISSQAQVCCSVCWLHLAEDLRSLPRESTNLNPVPLLWHRYIQTGRARSGFTPGMDCPGDDPAAEGSLRFQISLQPVCKTEPPALASLPNDNGSKLATSGKLKSKRKFVGVRQRPSGRWVAEIKDTTQKIRLWLGTFNTAEDAARAYDEAACLLRGTNTRTNFMAATCFAPESGAAGNLPSKAAKMLMMKGQQQHQNPSCSAAKKLIDFSGPKRVIVPGKVKDSTSAVDLQQMLSNSGSISSGSGSGSTSNSSSSVDGLLESIPHSSKGNTELNSLLAAPFLSGDSDPAFDPYSGFEQQEDALMQQQPHDFRNSEPTLRRPKYTRQSSEECIMLGGSSASSFMSSPSLSLPTNFHTQRSVAWQQQQQDNGTDQESIWDLTPLCTVAYIQ